MPPVHGVDPVAFAVDRVLLCLGEHADGREPQDGDGKDGAPASPEVVMTSLPP